MDRVILSTSSTNLHCPELKSLCTTIIHIIHFQTAILSSTSKIHAWSTANLYKDANNCHWLKIALLSSEMRVDDEWECQTWFRKTQFRRGNATLVWPGLRREFLQSSFSQHFLLRCYFWSFARRGRWGVTCAILCRRARGRTWIRLAWGGRVLGVRRFGRIRIRGFGSRCLFRLNDTG